MGYRCDEVAKSQAAQVRFKLRSPASIIPPIHVGWAYSPTVASCPACERWASTPTLHETAVLFMHSFYGAVPSFLPCFLPSSVYSYLRKGDGVNVPVFC